MITRLFNSSSLQSKNIIFIALCLTCVMSLHAFLSFLSQRSSLLTDQTNRISGEVDRLAFSMNQPLWNYDRDYLLELITLELKHPEIAAVTILLHDNKFYLGRINMDGVPSGVSDVVSLEQLHAANPGIPVSREIRRNEQKIGTVTIYVTGKLIKRELWRYLLHELLQSLLTLGTICILMYLGMQRMILFPLKSLSASAEELANGNLSARVNVASADEIGQLGASFNIMADALTRNIRFTDTVIESLPVFFYVRTYDGFVRWNRLLEEAFGMTREELLKLPLLSLVLPEDKEYVASLVAKILAEGYAAGNARFALTQGARTLHVTGRKMVLDDTTYMVGAAIDITEQIEMENAVKASEARLQLYFQRLPIGSIVWGKDFCVQQWNPAAERVFGYTAEEALGRSANELIVPDFVRNDVAEVWGNLLEGNLDSHSINKNRTRDGRIITCSWTNTPYHDNEGNVAGVISVVEDITEKMWATEALMESEERFRQIFTQNDDALVLIDLKTLIVIDANPAALALYRINHAEMHKLSPTAFIERNDLRKFLEQIPQEGILLEKAASYRPNGDMLIVSIKAHVISLGDEHTILCSIRDMTERLRLEEQIRTTQAKMIMANKMSSLGMLVAGVAHEINNPNQCIGVNAMVLSNIWRDVAPIVRHHCEEFGDVQLGGLPPQELLELSPKLFTGITESSQRINAIVTNMREYVMSGSGNGVAAFDINRVIDNAVNILWHNIQKYTENFRQELAEGLPMAKGNSQQIEQVIINLTMNALQALPDKSHAVTVSTALDEKSNKVVVAVRDAGRGMDQKTLQRLAEPFFTTREAEGGTGLGLYISKTIIKEYQGSLEFESTPGKGTTATVRLPADTGCVQ